MLKKSAAAILNEKLSDMSGVSKIFLEQNTFLKRFLGRFLKREQDIEDVAQEAYLMAYSTEQDRGEIEQPKAFLFSIAKNLALNELTRKSFKMTSYIADCQEHLIDAETDNSTEQMVEAHESLGMYCEAVAALPDKCRKVYLLRKVHGLRHKEIAERLNISLSSVEKYLRIGSLSCHDYMLRQSAGYKASKPVRDSKRVVPMEMAK